MAKEVVRSRRLRKKLYLGEFAILGFEFTCKINIDSDPEFEAFIDGFADLADVRDLFVSLDNDENMFEGFVTSHQRYGSATEEDRTAIEAKLAEHGIISDVVVGDLVDVLNEA